MKLQGWFWGVTAIMGLAAASGCSTIETSPASTAEMLSAAQDNQSQVSLAKLSERHGESAQAAELYEAILRETPQDQTAHHRLAVLAALEQQMEVANHHFQQALASGPPTTELLNDCAYAHYLQHNLDEAEEMARQALALDTQNKSARNNLALILGEKGQLEESLAEFRKVVDEAEAQANLAYVKAMRGDFDGAEKNYHYALQKDSTLRPAANALLELHDRRKGVVRDVPPEIAAVSSRSNEGSFFAPASGTEASQQSATRATISDSPPRIPIGDSQQIAQRLGIVAPSTKQLAPVEASAAPTEISIAAPAGPPRLIPGGQEAWRSSHPSQQEIAPWQQPTW